MRRITRAVTLAGSLALVGVVLVAQSPAPPVPGAQAPGTPPGPGRGGGRGGPAIVSPQIEADGRVTFRLLAPQAASVTVTGDINGSLVPAGVSGPTPPGPAPAAPAPTSVAPGVPGAAPGPPGRRARRPPSRGDDEG